MKPGMILWRTEPAPPCFTLDDLLSSCRFHDNRALRYAFRSVHGRRQSKCWGDAGELQPLHISLLSASQSALPSMAGFDLRCSEFHLHRSVTNLHPVNRARRTLVVQRLARAAQPVLPGAQLLEVLCGGRHDVAVQLHLQATAGIVAERRNVQEHARARGVSRGGCRVPCRRPLRGSAGGRSNVRLAGDQRISVALRT